MEELILLLDMMLVKSHFLIIDIPIEDTYLAKFLEAY